MCICSCIPAFLHVETVARVDQAVEVEETEEVYQEEEQQQFVELEQAEEQDLEANFANTDLQQGKHRFMLIPESLHYV